MIAVVDTAPINYLLQLKLESILPEIFERILIPDEVIRELLNEKTPKIVSDGVRQWRSRPPIWLHFAAAGVARQPIGRLHPGELAAMALAEQNMPCVLLMDDREALLEASRRGLVTSRLLALLFNAGMLGLLDFRKVLPMLEKTTFRMSRDVKDHFLRRWDIRQGTR